MKRRWTHLILFLVGAFGLAQFASSQFTGVVAMPVTNVKLGWEWRAGRALAQRATIRIESVRKESRGLFDIGNAPSMARSLPEPFKVWAVVMAVDRQGPVAVAATLEFRIPKVDLNGAEVGSMAVVGIIEKFVVCFTPVPSEINERDAASWMAKAPCE